MLRPSVSNDFSFVCVLVMKQKTVSLLLKANSCITYNTHITHNMLFSISSIKQ